MSIDLASNESTLRWLSSMSFGMFRTPLLLVVVLEMTSVAVADEPRFGATPQRSGHLFDGIAVPGNFVGKNPQLVPGVALPNEERGFPGLVPFSPTTSVVGNSFSFHKRNSWGYGQVVHGVNPLDMDVASLHDAYAQAASTPIKSDGQVFPFDHVVNVGGEFDNQKWNYFTGNLKIPTLSEKKGEETFDLKADMQQRKRNFIGSLDFPLLGGTGERFPLSGKYSASNPVSVQYAQAIPNVNPFHLSKQQIYERIAAGGNPNPTFLGRRR